MPPKKPAPRKASPARKPPAKKPIAKKPAAKKAAAKKPAFGRSGTAGKAEGDAAVRAWIAGVKPEHRPLVERVDALIAEIVPDVKRAVKWSMPMYGRAGQGWFAHIGAFKNHVAVGFFLGTSLDPPPPAGESGKMRRVNIHGPDEYDEKQLRSWIKQAASMKGWGTV
jgi:hypothetical protein